MAEQVPFEITVKQVKNDIVRDLTNVGEKYQLPSGLLIMITEEIIKDSKIAAYENAFETLHIPNPLYNDTETE